MKQSNKKSDLVLQNEKTIRKSQKHDANLQKNTTIYFQIGLIMCLLASYGALEMVFETTTTSYAYAIEDDPEDVEYTMDKFEIYKEPEPEKQKAEPETPKSTLVTDEVDVVDNDEKIKDALNITTEPETKEKKQVLDTKDPSLDISEPEEPISILAVQKVPVYPGCESATNNAARRKCLSEKLGKLIQKKFNPDVADDLGLSGMQKINVAFKINKQGEVEILKTRATHPKLEKEAKRVVGKIPTMEPGVNDNKPVEVLYMLPIRFNIQN